MKATLQTLYTVFAKSQTKKFARLRIPYKLKISNSRNSKNGERRSMLGKDAFFSIIFPLNKALKQLDIDCVKIRGTVYEDM